MKMLATFAALGLATVGLAVPAAAQINHTQHNQQQRIHQGVRSGALTQREAYRLQRNQGRINRAEDRMRASGGRLTYRERARLDRRQDRASARIYRQKHDRQGYR